MISAKEAKVKTKQNRDMIIQNEYLKEMKEIESFIAATAEKGEYACSCTTGSIKIDSIARIEQALKELGYKANSRFSGGVRYIDITWGDA